MSPSGITPRVGARESLYDGLTVARKWLTISATRAASCAPDHELGAILSLAGGVDALLSTQTLRMGALDSRRRRQAQARAVSDFEREPTETTRAQLLALAAPKRRRSRRRLATGRSPSGASS